MESVLWCRLLSARQPSGTRHAAPCRKYIHRQLRQVAQVQAAAVVVAAAAAESLAAEMVVAATRQPPPELLLKLLR